MDLRGDDLIVQHLRFRAGDIRKKTRSRDGFTEDSLTLSGRDIMVDHVSASWGIDESLSGGSAFSRMTVQYSIVSEGLYRTRLVHGEYDADHHGHSMGSLFKPKDGNGSVSVHHNLYAHNGNRNPAVGTYDRDQRFLADIRNNVIYNCRSMGYVSGASAGVRVNYVGNYAVFGGDSSTRTLFKGNEDSNVDVWASDNWLDVARNNRFGIPFNIIYGPVAPNGLILPELLTRNVVMQTFDAAAGRILAAGS